MKGPHLVLWLFLTVVLAQELDSGPQVDPPIEQAIEHQAPVEEAPVAVPSIPSFRRQIGQHYRPSSPSQDSGTPSLPFDWSQTDFATYSYFSYDNTELVLSWESSMEDVDSFIQAAHFLGKKVLVGIHDIHETTNSVREVAESVKDLVLTHGFDGIDIDWYFDSNVDFTTFVRLIRMLRRGLGAFRHISATLPAHYEEITDEVDAALLGQLLDWVTIRSFSFYEQGIGSTSGPLSPLYDCNPRPESTTLSVSQVIDSWIGAGIPAAKLYMGISGYSHVYKTKSRKLQQAIFEDMTTKVFQDLAPIQPHDWEYSLVRMRQKELLASDGMSPATGDYKRFWDPCTQTVFMWSSKNHWFWTYEDPQTVSAKSQWAHIRGLGGVNFFDSRGVPRDLIEYSAQELNPPADPEPLPTLKPKKGATWLVPILDQDPIVSRFEKDNLGLFEGAELDFIENIELEAENALEEPNEEEPSRFHFWPW